MFTRSICTTSIAILSSRALAQYISLSPATTVPSGASNYVDPSFAGFGIEPSNLFSFTGGDDTNTFSVQLLQNLADYAGLPAHIRLGGNTQDYMIYDASQTQYKWTANTNSRAQGVIAADSMIIGPAYFKALDRFPKGTPVTFGLNMAYIDNDWEDRIVKMAQGAVDGMKNVKLYSFEVGNEPDLWLKNSFRSAPWTGQTYTTQFLDRCAKLYERVLKPANLPSAFFEPPATASTIGTTFEIAQLVDDGIMTGRDGNNFMTAWNQHDYFYFIGVTPTPLTLDDLMDLDATNTQFAYWEKQVKAALNTGLPYVLREMSSVGPIGMPGVSDTFGASLWTLNFFMYAATLGIQSVQMHMTANSNASAWQPIPMYGSDTSFVRPQYYAHAAVAQLIGNGNGTTQISVLKTSNVGATYSGRIRAYAAYAKDNLQALVLINSKLAEASQDKGSFTFNINLGSANANKDVFLSYLTADGGDSQKGVTWNGLSYDDITGQSNVADATVNVVTADGQGKVSIPIRDSQAIVANIGWQLGVNLVLKPDPTQSKKSSAATTSMPGASNAVYTSIMAIIVALAMVVAR
ncbi:glycoside hydrolase family 79 protein [Cucurbitaria berberidis CBS 394.84]|uniref:Glycoside hydrolase family 79 protein n=1 Tax=Cucurbitaria berberidis CBS 394.84 TaxID=1168544 RepID=A0A9P4GIK5_9PLEO|nr:glycoside hydrolase family 79 protein [Cucurbitaria berberidis CBS 394.84]KAF1846843.1 glycoside hydrolase family 79 protein [Cucurbitaria berberidis CBS 394.84]